MGEGGDNNTGADDGTDSNDGWNDDNIGGLWGWLDSIVGGLNSIWEGITSIPTAIIDGIGGFFETLWGWLQNLWDSIKELPTAILEGIKDIFIPNTDELQSTFDSLISDIKVKLGVGSLDVIDSIFTSERPVDDIDVIYNIPGVGSINQYFDFKNNELRDNRGGLKIFDSSFLKDGVATFRPYVRGFLVLLLLFYNFSMACRFIGFDFGYVAGGGGSSPPGLYPPGLPGGEQKLLSGGNQKRLGGG